MAGTFLVLLLCLLVSAGSPAEAQTGARKPPGGAAGASTQAPASSDQGEGAAEGKAIREKIAGLRKAGKHEEALDVAQRFLSSVKSRFGAEHPATANALIELGSVYYDMWWYYMAVSLHKEALAIREKTKGPEHPATAAALAQLARAYQMSGYLDKALPLAQRALQIQEKALGPDDPQTAATLNVLAYINAQMGNHAQALPQAQRSLKIREKALAADDPTLSYSLEALATIHQNLGNLDQALPYAQRSAQLRERVWGLEHRATAVALRNLGYLYLQKKDYGQAEACFRRAKFHQGDMGMVELYLATGKYPQAVDLLGKISPPHHARPQRLALHYTQQGLALHGVGRNQEAYAAFLQAVKVIEDLRARSVGDRTSFFEFGLMGGYVRAYRGMAALLGDMAVKGETLPAALQTYGPDAGAAGFYFAEAVKGRSLLEAMAAGAGPLLAPPISGDLAAKEKSINERLAALEAKREETYTPFSRLRSQNVAQFQLQLDGVRREQEKLVGEIRQHSPRYAALRYPLPYKAAELPLKPGEVLLEFALGDKESFLFRVEPGGKTRVFRLNQGQEALERRLSGLLAPFRQSTLRREDLNRFSLSEAAALYRDLLAPALTDVAPGTRLTIVPDGVLGAFPFEALVVEAKGDWGKSVLLVDRWPVTYSQSAAILALNRHLGATRASKPLFALGDCIYDKTSPRVAAFKSGQAQAGEIKHAGPEKALTMSALGRGGQMQFPSLPETRKTVSDLATLFGVQTNAPQVLLDVMATETRVRQVPLEQYRYLFFGTHGFLADNLSGLQEPVLVLTQVENKSPHDGFLTFSEVLGLKLDADLVTLAACMTGMGQVMQGEGVLNFARAFQQAGARSVMVSLWNIPVDESLLFYTNLYQNLKAGKPKQEALKAARQAVRAKEPHPYFWSGLILHGEG